MGWGPFVDISQLVGRISAAEIATSSGGHRPRGLVVLVIGAMVNDLLMLYETAETDVLALVGFLFGDVRAEAAGGCSGR